MPVTLTSIKGLVFSKDHPVDSYKVPTREWFDVERHPLQRREDLRPTRHLRGIFKSHWVVFMIALPDGRTIKVDGHTRSWLWANSKLEMPPYLVVIVYSVASMTEAETLYEHHDSRNAVKQAKDTIQSALNAEGVDLNTDFLRAGKFSSMLSLACTAAGISVRDTAYRDRVNAFKSELLLLDSIVDLREKQFPIGFGAAALLGLRKHGKKALAFLQAFNDGLGVCSGKKQDDVHRLTILYKEARSGKTLAGIANNNAHMQSALPLIDRYIDHPGKLFEQAPSKITLAAYLDRVHTEKKVVVDRKAAVTRSLRVVV